MQCQLSVSSFLFYALKSNCDTTFVWCYGVKTECCIHSELVSYLIQVLYEYHPYRAFGGIWIVLKHVYCIIYRHCVCTNIIIVYTIVIYIIIMLGKYFVFHQKKHCFYCCINLYMQNWLRKKKPVNLILYLEFHNSAKMFVGIRFKFSLLVYFISDCCVAVCLRKNNIKKFGIKSVKSTSVCKLEYLNCLSLCISNSEISVGVWDILLLQVSKFAVDDIINWLFISFLSQVPLGDVCLNGIPYSSVWRCVDNRVIYNCLHCK